MGSDLAESVLHAPVIGGWLGRKPDNDAVSGVHTLITGLNGHGKTLMLVAEKLLPLVGASLEVDGVKVNRRIVQNGIPQLALPHEIMGAEKVDKERWVDSWKDYVREPGAVPHLDVPMLVQNWWLWAMPGDVLVIDEAQDSFPNMASGKAIPTYIAKLNTARHYGLQFIYLSQFPAILHANLRALVGPHEHVSRIFGGTRTVVYQWDRISPSLSIGKATKRLAKHNKRAFGLYKSAQVHTNFKQRLPVAVFAVGIGFALFAYMSWVVYQKVWGSESPQAKQAHAVGSASGASAPAGQRAEGYRPGQVVVARPMSVGPPVKDREPYAGIGVHMAGTWRVGEVLRTMFTLSVDGRAVATISDRELQRAGYGWRTHGEPCSGVLIFGDKERAVTCDAPVVATTPQRPGQPASGPAV